MRDDEIVKLFWDRDEQAIAESKDRYAKYCLYIAENVLHDRQDSEECLNDVLLAAWKSIPPESPVNLKTYLGKLTRETAIDRLRKRCARRRIPAGMIASLDELEEVVGENDVDSAVQAEELSRLISIFLRSVREEERNVFLRRYWYFDSVKEIQKRYGYGKSKVLVMLKRTRDKLSEYLKKEGYFL